MLTFADLVCCMITGLLALRDVEDDSELVDLARKGEVDAFRVLVERHQRWLMRILEHLLSNHADAEELTQNVFLKAYLNLETFRGDASFRTWVRAIATRQAYDFYRRGHRKGRELETTVEVQPEVSTSPSQEGVETLEAIQVALEKIAYPYREILVLRYVEDMEMSKIGELLELSDGAARMRLMRARDQFKDAFGELPS